jgi:hypothetical protein
MTSSRNCPCISGVMGRSSYNSQVTASTRFTVRLLADDGNVLCKKPATPKASRPATKGTNRKRLFANILMSEVRLKLSLRAERLPCDKTAESGQDWRSVSMISTARACNPWIDENLQGIT